MKFFSGFCLQNEQELFTHILTDNQYCVAGFSLGAIKALEYALKCNKRIDTLQLISPAFFMDKSDRFKQLQINKFQANKQLYISAFIKKIAFKIDIDKYIKKDLQKAKQDLQKLLYYKWDKTNLQNLKQNGTNIEVFLGENDNIINSHKAKDFFLPFATTYFIRQANHFLIY